VRGGGCKNHGNQPMKTLIALLLTCSSLVAQTSQHYSYYFTSVPLWDITGPFTSGITGDMVTGSVALQADGQFTGTRTEIDTLNGDYIEGSGFIKGRLSSTPSQIGLRYGWQGSYSGTVGGGYISATANGHGSGALIPVSRSVQLSETLRICVVHGRCSTSVQGIDLALDPAMDGTWQLDIDLAAAVSKLTGQAVLTLSTGRRFDYQVLGTQNVKRGTAILRLKGMGEATTSSLTLYTQGVDQTLVKLQGRLLGQKLKVP